MILTRTPMRVSLLGGGSDYPAHFLRHGGAAIGMAINRYVYVGVKPMPPGQEGARGLLRYRVQYSKVDDCLSIDEIRHPAVRAALAYLGIDEPLEFHIFSDLPGRSGLGGSSACAVGVLRALQAYKWPFRRVDPLELAAEAIAFEQHVIGEAVGNQDQIYAALGGIVAVGFDQAAGSIVRRLEVPPESIARLEESLILAFTGTMREAHLVAARQIAEAPERAALLDELAKLARIAEVPVTHGYVGWLGGLLELAWRRKRDLAGVTSPEIDALHDRGMALGASGAKLLGAGGGGFMLFCVPPEARPRFLQGIGAPVARFRVARAGSEVIVNEP